MEPLKIQLQHREPIKTVIKLSGPNAYDSAAVVTLSPSSGGSSTPKITIKPIPKPPAAGEEEPMQPSSHHRIDSPTTASAHIVPKLTIRTASAGQGAQSEIVPKLTIAYNHVVPSNSNNTTSASSTSADALAIGQHSLQPDQPPIPKMTIKANEIIVNNSSTATASSTNNLFTLPSTPSSRAAAAATAQMNDAAVLNTSPSVPKIKIKQISSREESAAATFTISRSSDDDDGDDDDDTDETDTTSPVKITPTVAQMTPTVPKLLVRVPKEDLNSDMPEVPKLTIRQSVQASTEIVIPKVTIKPIINPDSAQQEGSEPAQALVTPKITIKPIPRPGLDLSQPLEVITTPHTSVGNSGGGEFVSSIPDALCSTSIGPAGQQSPRIILKINKASKEAAASSSTTLQQQLSSSSTHNHNSGELKRALSLGTSAGVFESKRLRLDDSIADKSPHAMPVESKLKEILSRMNHQTTPQQPTPSSSTAHTSPDLATTPRKYQTNSSVRRPIRPPPSAQSDNAIQLPPEMELAASKFREEPKTKPVRLHPLLLHDIERAKLLEAMMNADAKVDMSKTDVDVGPADPSLCSEGSSSDCILVEEGSNIGASAATATTTATGSQIQQHLHPFASVNVKSVGNGPSDQDSGVDVSGSTASSGSGVAGGAAIETSADGATATSTKRGRGRPRKESVAEVLSAK